MSEFRAPASRFHGFRDVEIVQRPPRFIETTTTKHVFIQERDVSYRFFLHEHPYVQALMKRLLGRGTAGLQAADTEYAAKAALPGSVEMSLSAPAAATLPAECRIRLSSATHGTTGTATVQLAAGMELELAVAASASVLPAAGVLRVVLASSVPMQEEMTDLTLASAGDAVLLDDANATLGAATLLMPGGTRVTLPAGTAAVLSTGSRISLSANSKGIFVKGRRRPVNEFFSDFFNQKYNPNPAVVTLPYPVKDLDFSSGGAYSVYNWELFYHVPLTIAIHLSRNQRFAEAQRWFHYIFDPTDGSDAPSPDRFWKVRPFHHTDVRRPEELLVNLATGADPLLREETLQSISAWEDAPFRPHVIARYRQQAYMYKAVMAYLDNLIEWGDSLFRQDTGEAIDEAMMLYVLAANILGPRPQAVPRKGSVRPQTYAGLRHDLERFGVAMRDMEAELPFDLMSFPKESTGGEESRATLRSMGKALYMCVPRNDKLATYWSTVEDRLFKIRNSLNLQGVFRQLALFDPPIDPAMLARAAAAGLDVGAIVNGINQPLPLVRFQFLLQKATELAQEVKSLGGSLLSAMEKEEGEALSILRSKHERAIMQLAEQVRYGQLQEAIKAKEGLLQSLAAAMQRYEYYERQLGKKAEDIEKSIPQFDELDRAGIEKLKLSAKEPDVAPREIDIDISSDLGASGGKIVSSHERSELTNLDLAYGAQLAAKAFNLVAQGVTPVPDFNAHYHYWGVGGSNTVSGGSKLAQFAKFAADMALIGADWFSHQAGRSAKIGSYARREQEWAFQSNLAAGEISQIFRQLRAAEIREAVAALELRNHRQQMKHAEEIERFLNGEGAERNGKKTNKALYAWMKREVKGLYSQSFQLAFDVARKAERALQHELGDKTLTYCQYGYLAGKEGLLAGERLLLDIKRMEMAYHDLNRREHEMTRHVSMLQFDPAALIRLRATGSCTLRLQEALFDMDCPGHYFRRMKSVSVSIPCVTGPYASINLKLSLLRSSIRTTPAMDGAYARDPAGDGRFSDYFGTIQSIVTSAAQNDGGLFDAGMRDERYLPFENSGAISEWQLELPANPAADDPQQFDYATISDVILHVRYTARDGGAPLRAEAMKNIKTLISEAAYPGSVRLFSVRNEFPSEWARFKAQSVPAGQDVALTLNLLAEHYPFWSEGRLNGVARVDIVARQAAPAAAGGVKVRSQAGGAAVSLDNRVGELTAGQLPEAGLPPKPIGALTLLLSANTIADLWVAVAWSG